MFHGVLVEVGDYIPVENLSDFSFPGYAAYRLQMGSSKHHRAAEGRGLHASVDEMDRDRDDPKVAQTITHSIDQKPLTPPSQTDPPNVCP